jgi:ubiquinone/menaquinone biosynthesis C-methylase UbiE/ribosomal protein S27E
MTDMKNWLKTVQCADCKNPLGSDAHSRVFCTGCGRTFEQSQGIWNLLPSQVINKEAKDKEKEGWTQKIEKERAAGYEPPPEHYLALPDIPHHYYQFAAWYLRIVMEYGKPWKGKRVMELGAAECWATRKFAEAGAEAVALDYDPARMLKGQILLDRLPIRFLRVRGDAERLPFEDNSLDTVFCCSVLHHFFDLPRAVQEISRVLKPGGSFFGIHEAFHPPYYTQEQIINMSEDTAPNIEAGINESSYTASFYRNAFRKAGMKFDLIHPRWDVRENGLALTVKPGINIYGNKEYVPIMFSARAGLHGVMGWIARLVLKTQVWRIAANPNVFPFIRFHVLNWTIKNKIIAARKI